MSNYDYKTLQSIREADQSATNNDTLLSNTVEFNETDSLEHNRTIDIYNPPTKETIKSILLEELTTEVYTIIQCNDRRLCNSL